MWHDELRYKFGCDLDSIGELILLAQLSEDGYYEANTIMSKMLKKKSDKADLRNCSGFLHKCIKNARELLMAQYREERAWR